MGFLNASEISSILGSYANGSRVEEPDWADQSQKDALQLIASIVPAELFRVYQQDLISFFEQSVAMDPTSIPEYTHLGELAVSLEDTLAKSDKLISAEGNQKPDLLAASVIRNLRDLAYSSRLGALTKN